MKPLSSQHSSCSNGRSTAGCISRILRRILCFSSLPLCPFDHFNEHEQDAIGASGPTPGLVARLMGLESVPRIEPIQEIPSFKKSRSDEQISCQKFVLPYQELQDENFFILSFERKKSSKKQSMRRTYENNKENEEINVALKNRRHFQFENPGNNLLLPVNNSYEQSEKRRTKKTNGENEEGETENSSPNSVLEFVGFTTDQESASSGEISRLANSKMRRPLSDELEKELINNGDGEMDIRVGDIELNYSEKWDEIGAMETMKSRWLDHKMSKNGECFMEISRDVESSILDLLLDELLFSFSVN